MFGKIVLTIILVVVLAVAGTCAFNYFGNKLEEPPAKEQATWVIYTPSRTYYARHCEWSGDVLHVYGYWVMARDKWHFVDAEIELNKRAYGYVEAQRR